MFGSQNEIMHNRNANRLNYMSVEYCIKSNLCQMVSKTAIDQVISFSQELENNIIMTSM